MNFKRYCFKKITYWHDKFTSASIYWDHFFPVVPQHFAIARSYWTGAMQ